MSSWESFCQVIVFWRFSVSHADLCLFHAAVAGKTRGVSRQASKQDRIFRQSASRILSCWRRHSVRTSMHSPRISLRVYRCELVAHAQGRAVLPPAHTGTLPDEAPAKVFKVMVGSEHSLRPSDHWWFSLEHVHLPSVMSRKAVPLFRL